MTGETSPTTARGVPSRELVGLALLAAALLLNAVLLAPELRIGRLPPNDGIFHLASPASPVDFEPLAVEILKTGSLGTFNTIEYALAQKAWFFMASTSEVYGDPLEHPQSESYLGNVNPIGIRSVYDESKRFSEAVVMAYHRRKQLPTSIVRIFNTFGPRMRQNDGRVIPNFIGALVGRFYFQRRFGREWRKMIPVVGAGFFVGSGLISILSIGFVFLAKAVSTVPY